MFCVHVPSLDLYLKWTGLNINEKFSEEKYISYSWLIVYAYQKRNPALQMVFHEIFRSTTMYIRTNACAHTHPSITCIFSNYSPRPTTDGMIGHKSGWGNFNQHERHTVHSSGMFQI